MQYGDVSAEEGRNNILFHSQEWKTQSIERLMLETILQQAIERELLLYYQPKQDLSRGSISGVEALLRWHHPDLGLLQPSRFIPLARRPALIVPISWAWVLQTACVGNYHGSARACGNSNCGKPVAGCVASAPLPPAHPELLELEITESMVMQDVEHLASRQ